MGLVTRIEMHVQMLFLVETFAAKPARPLAGTILLFDRLLRTKYVPQRMKWTFQRDFYLNSDLYIVFELILCMGFVSFAIYYLIFL